MTYTWTEQARPDLLGVSLTTKAHGHTWSFYTSMMGWMLSSVRDADGMHTAWVLGSPHFEEALGQARRLIDRARPAPGPPEPPTTAGPDWVARGCT